MRRLLAFGLFVSVATTTTADLSACGEKGFFLGRIFSFAQGMSAPVPGTVLLYTNPASKIPAVLKETNLDGLLKSAGHKVEVVADASAVSRALSSGRYDIVIVDPADAAVAAEWKKAAPTVVVVPVVYKPTKPDLQAAERVNTRVLKAEKAADAITLVNDIVRARSRTKPS